MNNQEMKQRIKELYEDNFLNNIIRQGNISYKLSKLKKEELIILLESEICLTEELQAKIAELEEKNRSVLGCVLCLRIL